MFLIWVPLAMILLTMFGLMLSRQVTKDIPIMINGLIPSKSEAKTKEDSGTTVFVWYADKDVKDPTAQIFRGYADEGGRVIAAIPAENVGKALGIRVRHAAYKFADFQLVVPQHGVVHTMKMEKDGIYNGSVRGGNVGNLEAYYNEALVEAEVFRHRYIRRAERVSVRPLARIPVWFWLICYLSAIVAFAGDYWRYPSAFDQCLSSYLHSIYFSAVTITTLGYGEIIPLRDLMRLAVSFQAVMGIFLVGFALNSLFYGPPSDRD